MIQFEVTGGETLLKILESLAKIEGTFAKKYDRFAPGELVDIRTADDAEVCMACEDLAAGSPYTIEQARKQLPHHWGCRCRIAPRLGHVEQTPSLNVFRKTSKAIKRIRRGGEAGKRFGKSQLPRAVTIKKLIKQGARFVAPSGQRATRLRGKKLRKPGKAYFQAKKKP